MREALSASLLTPASATRCGDGLSSSDLLRLVLHNAFVLYAAKPRSPGHPPSAHNEFRVRLAERLCNPRNPHLKAQPPPLVAPAHVPGARIRSGSPNAGGGDDGWSRNLFFLEAQDKCQLCNAETGKSKVAHLTCRTYQVKFGLGSCWVTWHETPGAA